MPSAVEIFGTPKSLIGMLHVPALPGTPASSKPIRAIVEHVVDEARVLAKGGCNALLIENMHDTPYLKRRVGPEIVAAMAVVGRAVRDAVDLPLGVQILAGANDAALAVALACGAQFIRAEGFVFASIADEGLIADADAGRLLRYRRQIDAQDIAVLADVKKKHSSHAITADVDLAATVRAAEFFRADGVIVTGSATGEPVDHQELSMARAATTLPLLVGSGATPHTAAQLLRHADGLICGSALKLDGHWANAIDPPRVEAMATAVAAAR